MTETKMADTKIADTEIADTKMTDTKNADTWIAEIKMADIKMTALTKITKLYSNTWANMATNGHKFKTVFTICMLYIKALTPYTQNQTKV